MRACIALCAVLGALVAVAPATAKAPARGRIRVAVTGPDAGGHLQICAVNITKAKRFGVNQRAIVGRCGTMNARGVAVLRRVPKGRWGIAALGGTGPCAYPQCGRYKRVRVRAGRTTRLKWAMPMFG
jgi:hypothetical protein